MYSFDMSQTPQSVAEAARTSALSGLEKVTQENLGQYFTPSAAAEIMANMFSVGSTGHVSILDPGSGSGILSAVFVQRLLSNNQDLKVSVLAIELDTHLHPFIEETFTPLIATFGDRLNLEISDANFIDYALESLDRLDFVIQNPPKAKISAASDTAGSLRSKGISSPNLYSAFIELSLGLLKVNGEMVSITPRSFMNGTYFEPMRKRILARAVIVGMHIFHSRSEVFKDTGVLQEAIIVHWRRSDKNPDSVTVHSSVSHTSDTQVFLAPYDKVVTPDFLFVPSTEAEANVLESVGNLPSRLSDLGLKVSTGKVVDFRMRDRLVGKRLQGAVPMVYPGNLMGDLVKHPLGVKAQWFVPTDDSDKKLLLAPGTYILVKRFTTKEERRRLVASILKASEPTALDNKLNYIHMNGKSVPEAVANKVCAWLNSDSADAYFRLFSGHTQVNAGDLRVMPIPDVRNFSIVEARVA